MYLENLILEKEEHKIQIEVKPSEILNVSNEMKSSDVYGHGCPVEFIAAAEDSGINSNRLAALTLPSLKDRNRRVIIWVWLRI